MVACKVAALFFMRDSDGRMQLENILIFVFELSCNDRYLQLVNELNSDNSK